jgi:hypothetical protein
MRGHFHFEVSLQIYVDESGDLGWSFDKPYGQGGSSRFLTIAALIVPDDLDHLPKRKIKDLYTYAKWDPKREKKWVEMSTEARATFATNAVKLHEKHQSICYRAIVVNKQNVNANLRRDSNKLYNYMIRLLLLDELAKHAHVTLIPDPRSIKVQHGRSLHHYLDALLYEMQAPTTLETVERDSSDCRALQFTDMLAGVVGTHYEFGKSDPYRTLARYLPTKNLFFQHE